MILEFPEFLPDLPALNNPGTTVAENVIPAGASYKSVPDLANYSDALNSAARGAFAARDPQFGESYNFAGTTTKLYVLGTVTNGIWEDASKAGGYTLGSDDAWDFTQFGDYAIAVAFTEAIQTYQLGVSTDFNDLTPSTGTVPRARYVDTVHTDFLVVANTFDGVDGFKPNRVRWPGIGTIDSWAVSAVTQADFQDLDTTYGWINGIIGGNFGTIFQEKAITRMEYVGSPTIFEFTIVEQNQGTKYSGSIVRAGGLIYFLGLDGFRVFDGNQSLQIGVNKIDRFFFDDLDTNYDYLISSAVDYDRHIIMWAYPSIAQNQGAINSRILFYNYSPNATKRWSYANLNTELIFSANSEGYTLDQLDDWESAHGFSKNIDVLPYSLDSRVWTGNNILFGAFTSTHKLAFSSSNTFLTAKLETAEAQLTDGQKSDLFLTRPSIEGIQVGLTITGQVGTRNLLTTAPSYTLPIPTDNDGNFQSRSNARYHRLRVNISGGFTNAIGVEVLDFQPAGYR